MRTRVAVMAIIVEKPGSGGADEHALLHGYALYHRPDGHPAPAARHQPGVSVALDAPQDAISALAGKLGNVEGLSVKTAYSNVFEDE